MALANAVSGSRRPSQLITWTRADGNAETLTGATITGKIRRQGQGTSADLTGTFTVTDGAGGIFRWDYSTDDVATDGQHVVQFTATFGSSPTPARTFVAEWIVEESL